MAASSSSVSTVQLATLSFPILALIIQLAVENLGESDSALYKGSISGLALFALAMSLIGFLLSVVSVSLSIDPEVILFYVTVAVIVVSLLLMITILNNSTDGLDDQNAVKYSIIVIVVLAIMSFVLDFIVEPTFLG